MKASFKMILPLMAACAIFAACVIFAACTVNADDPDNSIVIPTDSPAVKSEDVLESDLPSSIPDDPPAVTDVPDPAPLTPAATLLLPETPKPTNTPAPAAAPETPGDNENSDFLKVGSGGESISPYEHFEWAKTYFDYGDGRSGFLHADGFSFYEKLHSSDIASKIPEIRYSDGLRFVLGGDCRISRIAVYDPASLDRIANSITKDELFNLLSSSDKPLMPYVVVTRTGRFIEAENDHEYRTNGYAFKVMP